MDTILFFHTSLRQAWRKELAGAYRYARTRGWRVQVVEPREGVTPPVARLAAFWNPVGCIAECSGDGGGRLSPRLFRGIPTVFLGRDPRSMPPEASFVAPSSAGIGERAARVFLEAGISSFAFIAQSARHFWSLDREADFANSLAIHGFKCCVFGRDAKWRQDGARASALAEFLKSLPRPCGILAENDYAAAEVLDLARKMRLHVPNDIAVIGVDNDADLCENARPSLTSVALDFEMAGYRASEILDAVVRDPMAGPFRETYPVLGVARRGSTPSGMGVPPRVMAVLAYIRENACGGITVADAARLLPGSRRSAEIYFRRATGRSIFEEIERVRFENVELLLRDRYRVIGAIADLCGWRTPGALRAAFRKRYGVSMSEWRGRVLPPRPSPSSK